MFPGANGVMSSKWRSGIGTLRTPFKALSGKR